MKTSRGKSAMGGGHKGKSKGKKAHRLEIRHGKSGGHVVTHHFPPGDDGQMQDPEEHIMPDKAALLNHIAENTPDDPAQAQAAPAAAAGPMPPQMGAAPPP